MRSSCENESNVATPGEVMTGSAGKPKPKPMLPKIAVESGRACSVFFHQPVFDVIVLLPRS